MNGAPLSRIELEQSELREDLERVRGYAEQQRGDVVEVRFENEPTVRLVVLVAGDRLATHERALRALVEHHDRLEVKPTPCSLTRLEEISREVDELARTVAPGTFRERGIAGGRLELGLDADQEALARTLDERYGGAVRLTVGAFAYPLGKGTGPRAERSRTSRGPRPPLLVEDEFEVALEHDVVLRPGGIEHTSLRIRNLGGTDVVIDTNGGLVANVLDPASGEVVGGFIGFQAMPLVKFLIAPGGDVAVPLVIATASVDPSLGYVVPPGRWLVDAVVHIEGRGRFRTPALPITVDGSL